MNTRWLMMAALPVLAIPFAWAQAKGHGENGKLTRVSPRSEQQDEKRFDSDAWRKKLTAGDLEARESAFDELVGAARRDPAAREAIEAWSHDESDANLAWTSRLALREIDRGGRRLGMYGGARPGWGLFGKDFDFENFAQRFDDLDSMFGDLRSQWDDMMQALPNPSGQGGAHSESQSMTLECRPDGVTCKVTEKVDGQDETREYTAKSMDELLEANPELRSKLGQNGPFVWSMPNGSHSIVVPPMRGRVDGGMGGGMGGGMNLPRMYRDGRGAPPAVTGEPRTDVLGIYCAPVGDARAKELDLESGEGLLVEETQPGTIASVLGLRAGDVLVDINGTTIHSAEDVKKVLADRDAAGEVKVTVAGSEGRRTLTWKPSAKNGSGGSGEKASDSESKSGSRKL